MTSQALKGQIVAKRLNPLESCLVRHVALCNGAKPSEVDEFLGCSLRDVSVLGAARAKSSGLVANPCAECTGDGRVECGTSGNDPYAETHVDDCERCEGTGNGICPGCDELRPYLVAGDGRCSECIAEDVAS